VADETVDGEGEGLGGGEGAQDLGQGFGGMHPRRRAIDQHAD
jgi:hypothetical protein